MRSRQRVTQMCLPTLPSPRPGNPARQSRRPAVAAPGALRRPRRRTLHPRQPGHRRLAPTDPRWRTSRGWQQCSASYPTCSRRPRQWSRHACGARFRPACASPRRSLPKVPGPHLVGQTRAALSRGPARSRQSGTGGQKRLPSKQKWPAPRKCSSPGAHNAGPHEILRQAMRQVASQSIDTDLTWQSCDPQHCGRCTLQLNRAAFEKAPGQQAATKATSECVDRANVNVNITIPEKRTVKVKLNLNLASTVFSCTRYKNVQAAVQRPSLSGGRLWGGGCASPTKFPHSSVW